MTISITQLIEDRDVDAALYLLERLLNVGDGRLGEKRCELEILQRRVERNRKLKNGDRHVIASTFREVIG